MQFVLFYHSLCSDWNHGNAHFLRGIVRELKRRGHQVRVFEPAGNWSLKNLLADQGEAGLEPFQRVYPDLESETYDLESVDLETVVAEADVVIVHEWSDLDLVSCLGDLRQRLDSFQLWFHDTHHRSVSAPEEMAAYPLDRYDGVLTFGQVLADRYRDNGWSRHTCVWHEAADTSVFQPIEAERDDDFVWVGNWGDDERTAELHTYLIDPIGELGLQGNIHGVRYPDSALAALSAAGITYGGWLANAEVPQAFARAKLTLHVPRRPYVEQLRGIPTIRVFEALACGIPLISTWWEDTERLFTPGQDFLQVEDETEMRVSLRRLLESPAARADLAAQGLQTIRDRHTCAHRVDELEHHIEALGLPVTQAP